MGLLGRKKDAENMRAERRWEASSRHAREAKGRASAARTRLRAGSDDPAADRYLEREADADRRIAQANARDARSAAKHARTWWT